MLTPQPSASATATADPGQVAANRLSWFRYWICIIVTPGADCGVGDSRSTGQRAACLLRPLRSPSTPARPANAIGPTPRRHTRARATVPAALLFDGGLRVMPRRDGARRGPGPEACAANIGAVLLSQPRPGTASSGTAPFRPRQQPR